MMPSIRKTKVLMAGVSQKTQRGMWSVVSNYFNSANYQGATDLIYVPTATVVDASTLKKALFFIRSLHRISRILAKETPDVVHLHVSEKGSVYRKKLIADKAKKAGTKVVLHMHGGSFFDFYSNGNDRDRKTTQDLLNSSDAILVLGNDYKERLEEIGVPEEKVSVVPNGVNVPETNPYKRTNNEMIYLGGITAEKGMLDLLDAIELVGDDWPKDGVVRLYGPLTNLDITREIEERGLDGRVIYGGIVTGKDKEEALAQASFAVLPSHFEVLPMVVLEAMAQGLPVLSTDVGMVKDMIIDGETGFLCSPEDSMDLARGIQELLALDDSQARRISDNAYEKVKEGFSTEGHIEKVLSAYEALMNRECCGDE